MHPDEKELLSIKELAFYAKRHPKTIYRHRKNGFLMPDERATLAEYRRWIIRNKTRSNGKLKIHRRESVS